MKSTLLTWKIIKFTPKENSKVRQNDIIVKLINTSRLDTQSLRSLAHGTNWNKLSSDIKLETPFPKFKEYTKTWLGPKCRCKVCINMWRECYLVFYIIIFLRLLHKFIVYLYVLKISARIWSVFIHGLYFFIFVYMQIYFFPTINKAFIHLFIHLYYIFYLSFLSANFRISYLPRKLRMIAQWKDSWNVFYSGKAG